MELPVLMGWSNLCNAFWRTALGSCGDYKDDSAARAANGPRELRKFYQSYTKALSKIVGTERRAFSPIKVLSNILIEV